MQINTLNDSQELADLLEQSTVLDTIHLGPLRLYVLEFGGQDVLAFSDGSDHTFVAYPCSAFDAESGGSIHDHARASFATDDITA